MCLGFTVKYIHQSNFKSLTEISIASLKNMNTLKILVPLLYVINKWETYGLKMSYEKKIDPHENAKSSHLF